MSLFLKCSPLILFLFVLFQIKFPHCVSHFDLSRKCHFTSNFLWINFFPQKTQHLQRFSSLKPGFSLGRFTSLSYSTTSPTEWLGLFMARNYTKKQRKGIQWLLIRKERNFVECSIKLLENVKICYVEQNEYERWKESYKPYSFVTCDYL